MPNDRATPGCLEPHFDDRCPRARARRRPARQWPRPPLPRTRCLWPWLRPRATRRPPSSRARRVLRTRLARRPGPRDRSPRRCPAASRRRASSGSPRMRARSPAPSAEGPRRPRRSRPFRALSRIRPPRPLAWPAETTWASTPWLSQPRREGGGDAAAVVHDLDSPAIEQPGHREPRRGRRRVDGREPRQPGGKQRRRLGSRRFDRIIRRTGYSFFFAKPSLSA